ncbi:MAG: rhodanese-like domain-containing protein [Planctomycetes bacterium]|nr:rhodanese-like domain-containing protein [Planctomycetota bacterium]
MTSVCEAPSGELCYAPQFGAAKDPVNLAGMIAANVLRGDHPTARWEDLGEVQPLLVDVRKPTEFAQRHVEGAISLPLDLRNSANAWESCLQTARCGSTVAWGSGATTRLDF